MVGLDSADNKIHQNNKDEKPLFKYKNFSENNII